MDYLRRSARIAGMDRITNETKQKRGRKNVYYSKENMGTRDSM
jgi:hypothetical protein